MKMSKMVKSMGKILFASAFLSVAFLGCRSEIEYTEPPTITDPTDDPEPQVEKEIYGVWMFTDSDSDDVFLTIDEDGVLGESPDANGYSGLVCGNVQNFTFNKTTGEGECILYGLCAGGDFVDEIYHNYKFHLKFHLEHNDEFDRDELVLEKTDKYDDEYECDFVSTQDWRLIPSPPIAEATGQMFDGDWIEFDEESLTGEIYVGGKKLSGVIGGGDDNDVCKFQWTKGGRIYNVQPDKNKKYANIKWLVRCSRWAFYNSNGTFCKEWQPGEV